MQCSDVGIEIWFFAICSAALLYLFTFGARPFSRWLRARRPRSRGLQVVPAFLLDLWSLRVLAVIPAIMLFPAILGVICFIRGPG